MGIMTQLYIQILWIHLVIDYMNGITIMLIYESQGELPMEFLYNQNYMSKTGKAVKEFLNILLINYNKWVNKKII